MADRSSVWSILKCAYGLGGVMPPGVDNDLHESWIQRYTCCYCVAHEIAKDYIAHGAVPPKRLDGSRWPLASDRLPGCAGHH